MHSFNHNLLYYRYPSAMCGKLIEITIHSVNCEMRTGYLFLTPRFSTIKRLPLFSIPSFWNLAGNGKKNLRQHLSYQTLEVQAPLKSFLSLPYPIIKRF